MTNLDRTQLGAMLFDDEFAGPLDLARWNTVLPWGSGGKDSHVITDDASLNAFAPGAVTAAKGCVLQAAKGASLFGMAWSSGMICSKQQFAPPLYVEVKAQLPKGAGLHSGIWLYGEAQEIDIVETLGLDPCTGYCTTHYGPGEKLYVEKQYRRLDTSAQPINFGLTWTAANLVFYQNDVEVARIATPAGQTVPMWLLVTLGVGGWGGTPAPALTSAQLLVAHARVYQWKGA